MWAFRATNPYNVVLTLQLLCFFAENEIGAGAQHRDYTCEVGQEKDGRGVWRWVLPYKDPCICTRVISGGMNTITPSRPFKPVYVDTPWIGDNIRKIRKHYNLNCTDVDECTAARKRCGGNADCIGTKASFMCRCKDGYIGDGFTCIDDDECMIGSQTFCDANARCKNTVGSYTCVCNTGYKPMANDVTCEDINECMDESQYSCDVNAKCENTVGNYTCVCKAGYVQQDDDVTCEDVNECTDENQNSCDVNAKCENTVGNYTCICNAGYKLQADDVTCEDINECTDKSQNSCDVNAKCKNTVGNYTCVCNAGYELLPDDVICEDINECMDESQNSCDVNAECENTVGNYTCVCNAGYKLLADDVTCEDINECMDESQNSCDVNEKCENTVGNYTCVCNAGYELLPDDVTCEVCSDYLGMEDGTIPNENIEASSTWWTHQAYPWDARLHGSTAWAAGVSDIQPWIQANLGFQTYVSGVITQGDGEPDDHDYVTLFEVSISLSTNKTNQEFLVVDKEFSGPTDNWNPVEAYFPQPILARVVRITCLERQGNAFRMRFEIVGCKK